MPGTFHGINLASNALRAFQFGMDITGHNLANVNTRGYTRQSVEYGAMDPTRVHFNRSWELGQGVTIESINRVRDSFLDARMQYAQGDLGRFQTLSTALQQIQGVFNEPGDSGIASALDKFFNSWSALGSNPSQAAARLEVQQTGQVLANRIRSAFANLTAQANRTNDDIRQTIAEVDSLSSQIANLNEAIRQHVAGGGSANDLMDQRNMAIDKLSQLIAIDTVPGPNGDIYVHFGGYPLVDTAGAHSFPATYDAAAFTVSDGTYNYPVRAGKLMGQFETLGKIAQYKASLDTLANTLRAEVNTIHKSGINPNGGTDIPFFTENSVDPQNGAIDFDLTAAIKADPNNIVSSLTNVPGDGGLALSIAGLRSAASALLGGKTYAKWYAEFISGVAGDTNYAKGSEETHLALTQQVEQQRQSVSGVSMDDEMANMLRFQRSYQAAAKILSIFDQVTEDLIAMVR